MMSTFCTRLQLKAIFLSILLACSIQVVLFGYAKSLFAANQININGQVSLPGGATAPAAGIRVNLIMIDLSGQNDKVLTPVTIPDGASSVTYSAVLPYDNNASWRVAYYYWGRDYVQFAYYSSSGTTWKNSEATQLGGGQDHSGINLPLLQGKRISGNISLPSGRVSPAGGKNFYANSEEIDYKSGVSRVSCFLQAGQNSSSYYLTVPDDTGLQFRIFYTYYGTDYIQKGYYSNSGTQKNVDLAAILPGGQDHSGVNMTVLTKFSWDMFLPAFIKRHHS